MSNPSDFIIENGVLTKYVGPSGDVVIPEGVVEIGKDAFREGETKVPCSTLRRGFDYKTFRDEGSLKKVAFPSSLLKIGDSAFQGCTALTKIELPDRLEEIGALAFFACEKLKRIHISEANPFFETIDGVLFRKQEKELICYPAGKKDKSYTIPAGTEAVAASAFSRTPALEEITIPNTVWRFEDRAFMDPAPLMEKFTTYDMFFRSIQIEPGGKQKQIGKNVFNFRGGKDISDYYRKDTGPLYYPGLPIDFVKEKSIQTRLALGFCTMSALYSEPYRSGYEAYANKNKASLLKKAESLGLKEVKAFFDNVKTGSASTQDFIIRDGILLKYTGPGGDVVIPDGVTEIGEKVFKENNTLKSVSFPESLQIIGIEAFANCSGLTAVTIPSGVKEIRFCAFDWCKNLKEVRICDLEAWCKIAFGGAYANCGNPLSAGASLYVDGKELKDLLVPEGVETIGNYAFYHCVSLESVTLPAEITEIGEYSFFDCTNLTRVSLSPGVTSIGNGAFCGCKKLSELNIPVGVSSIGEVAFCRCKKLSDLTLPEEVEILGEQAFGDCGKLKVSLPSSLKRPKPDMFGRLWRKAPFSGSTCSVRVEKWSSLLTKMMEGCTIEEIVTSNYGLVPAEILLPVAAKMMNKKGWDPASDSGKALLDGLSKCAEKQRSVALTNPEWLQLLCDNKLIKAKDLDAFLAEAEKQSSTECKAILLNYENTLGSETVTKARVKKEKEKEAYEDALVERAAARDPSKGIEGMTFVITGQLKAWPKVWSSRKEVEAYLTRYGAKLGDSLTKETDYLVTNDADSDSAKNEKAGKLGVEVITEEEFNRMVGRRFPDEETVRVPAWVKTIEPAAFSFPDWESWKKTGYKRLKEVELPEGLTAIGEKAFAGAENLEKIDIPGSVTSIERYAFAACSGLSELTLPKDLQSIGSRAFDGCSGLKRILVPEGVTTIGIGAFGNCANLEELVLPASVEQIELMAFDGCPKLTIHAQAGSFAAGYARINGISLSKIGEENAAAADGSDDFVIENGVLEKYVGLGGDVTIPEGVTEIAPMAFYGCLSLTSVSIPEGVRKISFSCCCNLSRINIPNSVTSFGYGDFFNCSSLAELTIPESVRQIGKQAFYGCRSLKKIIIPGSAKDVEEEAFMSCSALETIVFSEGVENLGKNEFFDCDSLKDIYLPASLQKIGRDNHFVRCTIHAPKKSYAEKYAKSHKIAYAEWEKE